MLSKTMRRLGAAAALAVTAAFAAPAASAADISVLERHPGKSLWENAGCMNCHKWHGMGGSGYGGTPINFREGTLTLEQLEEVIACGRPATAMPLHHKGAYAGYDCYGGLTKEELGEDVPSKGRQMLNGRQITYLADWVIKAFQERPDVSKEDCSLYFGQSKMCTRLQVDQLMRSGGNGH